MKFKSIIERRGRITFPEFMNERIYMRPFLKSEGLPEDIARWQPTVDAMLDGVDTDLPIYLMVDQAVVPAGVTHRRPGVHVDGYWIPMLSSHGYGGGHGYSGPSPSYPPPPPPVTRKKTPKVRKAPEPPPPPAPPPNYPVTRVKRRHRLFDGFNFNDPEGIILATDVQASQAFAGEFEPMLGPEGDCHPVSLAGLERIPILANHVYAGNVSMLHDSLPVDYDVARTLVRLNVPGWTPEMRS